MVEFPEPIHDDEEPDSAIVTAVSTVSTLELPPAINAIIPCINSLKLRCAVQRILQTDYHLPIHEYPSFNDPSEMFRIAYCSNVHAGANLPETRTNLENYACGVRNQFSPNAAMGIGLWLSDRTAESLVGSPSEVESFRGFLNEKGLDAFTLNGFPFGNFHKEVVKKDVYLPTWFEGDRLRYTRNLVELACKFSSSSHLSISTLPLAWGDPPLARGSLAEAANNLRAIADLLSQIKRDEGRHVTLCIEPEPGCQIQYSSDLIRFFEDFLIVREQEDQIREHIAVCHDVCHAVVMCETQRDVLKAYKDAGIQVGKVQISSAVVVDFDAISRGERQAALQQLSSFAEDRYLHQTTIQQAGMEPSEATFFSDLPNALQTVANPEEATGVWRIHFHVPVYLEKFGHLGASQADIVECLACCREYSDVEHFEVETYAWNVLPQDLREDDLATGIANEMKWFASQAQMHLSTQ